MQELDTTIPWWKEKQQSIKLVKGQTADELIKLGLDLGSHTTAYKEGFEMFSFELGKIDSYLLEIDRNFLLIAERLARITYSGLVSGYFCFCDIYDFAEERFGFCRTTTKNFISIYNSFMDGVHLKSDFKDYSYSQLVELLPLSYTERLGCSPSMSVRELRAYKKSLKTVNVGQTSDQGNGIDSSSVIELKEELYDYVESVDNVSQTSDQDNKLYESNISYICKPDKMIVEIYPIGTIVCIDRGEGKRKYLSKITSVSIWDSGIFYNYQKGANGTEGLSEEHFTAMSYTEALKYCSENEKDCINNLMNC